MAPGYDFSAWGDSNIFQPPWDVTYVLLTLFILFATNVPRWDETGRRKNSSWPASYGRELKIQSGGWFGTCFIFPYFGNSNPNWRTLIFFRGVGQPPTSRSGVCLIVSLVETFLRFLLVEHGQHWDRRFNVHGAGSPGFWVSKFCWIPPSNVGLRMGQRGIIMWVCLKIWYIPNEIAI